MRRGVRGARKGGALSDVTCACCSPLVAEIRARGLDPEPLVEGLGLPLSEFENPRNRVDRKSVV